MKVEFLTLDLKNWNTYRKNNQIQ